MLDIAAAVIKPGISTDEIDRIVHEVKGHVIVACLSCDE